MCCLANMEDFQEPLSLGTFEPDKAYPPYLTTPRSLEACRMNGVNPVELVEIPATEYQKDFPNDPDAAQRRFERIDGARRRTLQYVMEDWKKLCATGWMPPLAERPPSANEVIMNVRPEAHCKLLELQAEKFRKIEQDNFDALNRLLKMEVMRADQEVRNQQITQKHEAIAKDNEALRKKRMEHREQLHREQMERQKRKEEAFWQEIRQLQRMDQQYAIEKTEKELENKRREKERREQMEFERVQRTAYTQQLKQSIVHGIDTKIDAKKQVLELREMTIKERQEEARKEHERQLKERKEQKERRLQKAREDQKRHQEETRKEMLDRIAQNEEHRRRIAESREKQKADMGVVNESLHQDKLAKIKAANDNAIESKAKRTLENLQAKEELARQELKKVQEAQEKRRTIKAIRQEAYNMANMRAKKAQDYRLARLNHDLRTKEERCKAIKNGFYALDHMRNSMKDIMERTTNELKWEMHLLRHSNSFTPDRVIKKALSVGDKALFPKLERTFGIVQDPGSVDAAKAGATTIPAPAADLFPAGAFGGTDDGAAKGIDGLDEGGIEGLGAGVGGGAARQDRHAGKEGSEFEPLPVKTLTKSHLKSALSKSKQRVNERQIDQDPYGTGRSRSPSPHNKRNATNGSSSSSLGFSDDEDGDSQSAGAILKLDPADEAHLHQRKQNARAATTGAHSRSGRYGSSSSSSSSSVDRAPDVELPEMKLAPLDGSDSPANGRNNANMGKSSSMKSNNGRRNLGSTSSSGKLNTNLSRSQGLGSSKSPGFGGSSSQKMRTDVNEKAVFLDTGPGKFRREFSADHPLVAGGSGKYKKEMKQGLTPVNFHPVEPQKPGEPALGGKQPKRSGINGSKSKRPAGKTGNVTETLKTAADIERLTYTAQSRVVDPHSRLEQLRKQQNETLKRILQEEREAEEERERAVQSVGKEDEDERKKLEQIFAEERRRASDRIIEATREHEQHMKDAILSMMELGNNTKDNRLPVDRPFNS